MGTAETDGIVKRLNPIALLRRTSESSEEVPSGDVVEMYKNAGIIYGTRKHEWDSGVVQRTSSPRSVSLPMSPVGAPPRPNWRYSVGDSRIVEEDLLEEEEGLDLESAKSQETDDEEKQLVPKKTRAVSLELLRTIEHESEDEQEAEESDKKIGVKSEGDERSVDDGEKSVQSQGEAKGSDDNRSVFSFEEDFQMGRNLSVNYHKPAVAAAAADSPDPLVDAMLDTFDSSPYYEDSLEEFEQKYASFLEPYEEESYDLDEYNDANDNDINEDKGRFSASDVSPLRVSKIYLQGDESDDDLPPDLHDELEHIDQLKHEIDEFKDDLDELKDETAQESFVSPSTSISTRSRPSLSLKIPTTTRTQQYDFLDYDYSLDDYELGDYDDHLVDEANAIGLDGDDEDYRFAVDSDAQISIRSSSSGSSGRRRALLRRDSSVIHLKDNTITLFSRTSEKEEAYYALRETQFGIAAELPTIPRKTSLTPISERSYEGI